MGKAVGWKISIARSVAKVLVYGDEKGWLKGLRRTFKPFTQLLLTRFEYGVL